MKLTISLSIGILVGCVKPPARPDFQYPPVQFPSDQNSGNVDGTPSSPAPSSPAPASAPTPASMPATSVVADVFTPVVTSAKVVNAAGNTPAKGEAAKLIVTLQNAGKKAGTFNLSSNLTSKRFSDFTNVNLGTLTVTLAAMESKSITLAFGPYLHDDTTKKEYAMGSGAYTLSFDIEQPSTAKKTITNAAGKDFSITNNNVVFTAVLWQQSYLDKVGYTQGLASWLDTGFNRRTAVYKGTSNDQLLFDVYSGFDDMLGIKTMFKDFQGVNVSTADGADILSQAQSEGKRLLGLKDNWHSTCDERADKDNHGFDMNLTLISSGFGGLAWLCGSTAVAGVFDGDPSIGRTQMVMIHEAGHNYGAPHCDPLQGYIMCSGEKNNDYIKDGTFVWHVDSVDAMGTNKKRSSK
ncbi:MAG: hypothetical protein H7249_16120 [Chitinophagaceae bacterium]|nr:hypothetical protein [Oligoflexus sp.]